MDTNGSYKLEKSENMLRIETTREHAHQQHGLLCLMVALCSSGFSVSISYASSFQKLCIVNSDWVCAGVHWSGQSGIVCLQPSSSGFSTWCQTHGHKQHNNIPTSLDNKEHC